MNDALVIIENVSKTFNKGRVVALKSMNFVIKPASFTGIVGPDGAGKTTMIRIMSGLMYPDEGRVIMGGVDIHKDNSRLYDKIGYMPQKFGLYEDLTVMENLKLYAGVRGIEKVKQKSLFDELLSFTSLGPFTGRLTGKLSGGMKQKLGLACVLMSRPQLLLLDEPSVGVDPISRRELWKMTAELTKKGVGIVWSTSYLDEAEKCQDIILLNNGTILYNGKPQDMVIECNNRAFHVISSKEDKRSVLARLLDRENVIDGLIQGNKIRVVTNKPGFKTADLGDVNLKVVTTEPRFEDAFVNRLGGCPKGGSLLAASIKEVAIQDKVVIECFDLTKKFGNFTAADKISFKINKGEVFGFLGPNGAGKSTTFRMLCGLLKPTSGSGKVVGYAMQHQGQELRSNIGYMAQKFSLYNNLTVKQNLQFFSGIYGLRGHIQQEAIQKMIEIFNFAPILNSSTKNLSLGFRQRLALACAVMHNPPILFLDEPTSGVDPIMRREFWLHINGMVQKGVTIMVSTHFMEEAEYCDRIALIYQGKKIAEGSPDELKEFARSDENLQPNMEEAFIALINKMNAQ